MKVIKIINNVMCRSSCNGSNNVHVHQVVVINSPGAQNLGVPKI